VGVLVCLCAAFSGTGNSGPNLLEVLVWTFVSSVSHAVFFGLAGLVAEAIYRSIVGPPKAAARLLQQFESRGEEEEKAKAVKEAPAEGSTPKQEFPDGGFHR
jgi:hypothetical protein